VITDPTRRNRFKSRLLCTEEPYRSDLKPARTSSAKSFGCSQAAKCPRGLAQLQGTVGNAFATEMLLRPSPRDNGAYVRFGSKGDISAELTYVC
jgi:hypothetical protein